VNDESDTSISRASLASSKLSKDTTLSSSAIEFDLPKMIEGDWLEVLL
jgi:hypothetical protein